MRYLNIENLDNCVTKKSKFSNRTICKKGNTIKQITYNKKGLSDVIATVLIILLALAAVVIVWSFVSPSLKNSGTQIDIQTKCLSAEVKPTVCSVNTSSAGSGTIQLISGDPAKVKLIIIGSAGEKTPGTPVASPSQTLGTVKAGDVDNVKGTSPYKASASAIFIGSDGKEYACPESPSVIPCTPA